MPTASGNAGVGHLVQGRLRQYGEADGLGPAAVVVIAEDRDGGVWAESNSGLYRFGNDRFSRQAFGPPGQPTAVLSTFTDRTGALFVGTASGLLKSDRPLLNANPMLSESRAYPAIGTPLTILDGRLLRFQAQLRF